MSVCVCVFTILPSFMNADAILFYTHTHTIVARFVLDPIIKHKSRDTKCKVTNQVALY